MNTLELLGWASGLGFLAGIRLYATILALGLAIRFDWIALQPQFQNLEALSSWWVIGLAGIAFLVEFVADKVPWLDSIWDLVHTFVRPLGAAAVAIAGVGNLSPTTTVMIGLLTGGVALTSHSAKAATRVAVNHSPEPFSNIALSLAGDLAVPAGLWLISEHPLLVLAIVCVFLLIFAVLARWIFRRLRSLFRRFRSQGDDIAQTRPPALSPSAAP